MSPTGDAFHSTRGGLHDTWGGLIDACSDLIDACSGLIDTCTDHFGARNEVRAGDDPRESGAEPPLSALRRLGALPGLRSGRW